LNIRNKKLEIPDECPYLKTCEAEVLGSDYDTVCTTRRWVRCKFAFHEAKKYTLKPREWKMIKKLQRKEDEEET